MTDSALVTSLRLDQRERWQQGDRRPVEEYLKHQSLLQADSEALLDLIYNEIVLREERDEAPQLEEYLRRFPDLGEQLRLLFEVHRAVEAEDLSPTVPGSGGAAATRPEAVPGYEILGELGRGGMGVVYKARQTALKRLVALKMILAGPHAGSKAQTRFRAEAEAVARLQHPHIVQIYEVGEHDGQPYFSLELVDGGTLAQKLDGEPQPARPSAELVETLARAMSYAHQRGILHRDLKPSNVLLTSDGVPKITDFGLAKQLDSAVDQTGTGAILGTPNYMAPEQATGQVKEIGTPADVYALGAILYEMLTGHPPFRAATALATLEQVRSREAVPPRQLQTKVPRDLDSICLKCLEKEPHKRYASADELADDLRRFREGEPTRARPTSVLQRGVKWARRRPAVAALVGVIVLACVAGVGGSFAMVLWHNAQLQQAVNQAREDEARAKESEKRVIEQKLEEQTARQNARARYATFIRRRDEALFSSIGQTQNLEVYSPENVQATAAKALEALAGAGVRVDSGSAPELDPYFSPEERQEVAAGCYALLLLLAEAVAEPPSQKGRASFRDSLRQALRYLDRAAGLAPPTQAYHRRRTDYLTKLGDTAAARSEQAQAEALRPTTAIDYFLLGVERFRGGQPTAAARDFSQALRLQPGHFWAQYYLAFCYLELERYGEAAVGLTATLDRRPDFVWTYLCRGFAYGMVKDFEAAEADFRQALQLQPHGDALCTLYANRGLLRLQQERYTEAASDLEQAIALKPEMYRLHLSLAQVHERRQHYGAALREFDRAVQLGPPASVLARLHVSRANCFNLEENYPAALEATAVALRLQPLSADAYWMRAKALLELKSYEPAARSYTRYLELGGKPQPLVYQNLGLAYLNLGRYGDAVQYFTLGLGPQATGRAYSNRGWAYFFADAWQLALDDFDRALQRDPKNSDAYAGRGLVRLRLGRPYREAAADAEEALRYRPDSVQMLHNVACIFAGAVARATADASLPDRQAVAARYRDRALEVLRLALDRFPADQRLAFWQTRMSPDKDLDPIRGSDGFRRLEAQLKAIGSRPSR